MPICLILPGEKNTISGINCYLCRNKVDMWKLDINKFFDLNVTIHLIKLKKILWLRMLPFLEHEIEKTDMGMLIYLAVLSNIVVVLTYPW